MKLAANQFRLVRRNSCSKLTTIFSAAAALLTSPAFAAIAPGDLIITEVMANPASVSDTVGEWFEIYNATASTLDIEGLLIRDEGSNSHTISGSLLIGAGSYLVLGRNADDSINGGYHADYQYSSFTLGNSSDQVILEYDGSIIDSLSYDSADIFGLAGISAELTSSGFAATPASFVYGDGDIGTPGSAGSDAMLELGGSAAVPVPAAGWLMISALSGLFAYRRQSKV